MKKPMKQLLLLFTMVSVFGLLSSCKEEGPHKDNIAKFTADINVQPAKGTGAFEFNKTTKELSYNISYSNVTPTAVTINVSPQGWDRGSVIFDLPGFSASQVSGKTRPLTSNEIQILVSGQLYVNIQTAEDPSKEYRGNLLPVEF